jgi:CDP-paratose 2-epimerase
MSVLITGGAGFIGANLADRLADEGHEVVVFDSLVRPGVEDNLAWLRERHPGRVRPVVADLRDTAALRRVVDDADVVFHLAAQVAVTTSLADPMLDFEVNLRGTVQLLDLVRQRGGMVPVIFASTNKVYGDLADVALELHGESYRPREPDMRGGVSEARRLDFHTPYGCSKGAADQYVLDYGRSFGVPTAVLRMSCIYGRRQMGNEDQGWVAHFLRSALRGKPISIFGDGCQVRDILDVADAVDAYVAVWQRIDRVRGRAFNLGGGPDNAVSLRQVLAHIETVIRRPVAVEFFDWRPGDQRYYVSDVRAATTALGLRPPLPWRAGVAALAESFQSSRQTADLLS